MVTSGQLLSGVGAKNAITITSLSEGLTCLLGVILYCFYSSQVDWSLSPYLLIGALGSVPLSVYTVKKISGQSLRIIVGVFTFVLAVSLSSRFFYRQLEVSTQSRADSSTKGYINLKKSYSKKGLPDQIPDDQGHALSHHQGEVAPDAATAEDDLVQQLFALNYTTCH